MTFIQSIMGAIRGEGPRVPIDSAPARVDDIAAQIQELGRQRDEIIAKMRELRAVHDATVHANNAKALAADRARQDALVRGQVLDVTAGV